MTLGRARDRRPHVERVLAGLMRPPAPAARPGASAAPRSPAGRGPPSWRGRAGDDVAPRSRPAAPARSSPQPPRRCEPDRQPGGHGDRAAPVEREHVVGRRTRDAGDRRVGREQLRAVPAQRQRGAGDGELGGAGVVGPARSATPSVPGPSESRRPVAGVEVDEPPVVGVDQALLPQLAALVDVGHAGDGDRDQLGRERVAPPGPRQVGRAAPRSGRPRGGRRTPRRRRRARPPRTSRRARSTSCGRRPRASPSRRRRAAARGRSARRPRPPATAGCRSRGRGRAPARAGGPARASSARASRRAR